MSMAGSASKICEEALESHNHVGFTNYFVKLTLSHLYNVQGTIELQTNAPRSGFELLSKTGDLRRAIQRPGNDTDEMWVSYAEQNLALSLMGNGKAEEALPVYLTREHVEANRDLNMANQCQDLGHPG